MTFSIVRKACLAAAVLLAAGCASSFEPLKLQDGSQGYRVYCGGLPYSDEADCVSRASSLCGDGGYTIVKNDSVPYNHTEMMWDNTTRMILVRCNNPQ